MEMTGIRGIYRDMRSQNLHRCQFEFTYATVDFDVIFKTDCKPFILMFGIKINNKYFEIEMNRGFEIKAEFKKEIYNMLVKLFKFSGDSWEPFKPIHFFEALNRSIPSKMKSSNIFKPQTVAKYKRDIDEASKIYFCGWINHEELKVKNRNYERNVTRDNLLKTKELLGEQAYIRCKEDNVSSKWTNIASKEMLDEMYRYES